MFQQNKFKKKFKTFVGLTIVRARQTANHSQHTLVGDRKQTIVDQCFTLFIAV